MNIRKLALLGLSVVLAVSAEAVEFSDIEFWVGDGANESALVLDWNDGKSPESLVWGYRWDGSATGEDMFRAVVEADDRLFARVSTPGTFGTAVYGIGYDLDADDNFGVDPTISFTDGLSVGSTVDGSLPSDADDHWTAGFFSNGFWGYYVGGTGATPSWSFASTGVTGRSLSDGSWDGLSWAPDFSTTDPSEPVAAVIPEPASVALVAMGVAFGVTRRRVCG